MSAEPTVPTWRGAAAMSRRSEVTVTPFVALARPVGTEVEAERSGWRACAITRSRPSFESGARNEPSDAMSARELIPADDGCRLWQS